LDIKKGMEVVTLDDHICCSGFINIFFVNHKRKEIGSNLEYCEICHPNSLQYERDSPWSFGWEIIEFNEYQKYIKKGYREI